MTLTDNGLVDDWGGGGGQPLEDHDQHDEEQQVDEPEHERFDNATERAAKPGLAALRKSAPAIKVIPPTPPRPTNNLKRAASRTDADDATPKKKKSARTFTMSLDLSDLDEDVHVAAVLKNRRMDVTVYKGLGEQ